MPRNGSEPASGRPNNIGRWVIPYGVLIPCHRCGKPVLTGGTCAATPKTDAPLLCTRCADWLLHAARLGRKAQRARRNRRFRQVQEGRQWGGTSGAQQP